MAILTAEGGDRQMVTLRDAIHQMGDVGKTISYLKVDVEGAEISSISNWIIDKLPQKIDQVKVNCTITMDLFIKRLHSFFMRVPKFHRFCSWIIYVAEGLPKIS